MTDLKRIYQSDLPSRAIAVYLYLRGRANREGACWPAIPTMARELKMSESTVRRGVRDLERAGCKNRHPSPICTRFEHHFHVLKPHLHRRSFSDTLPENQRHLIALKRYPLWHMQKLCQLSQLAELRSTFFRNRNAVLCQDVLQLSNPLALSLEFFLSCVKVFHRLTLHLVVAGPFQF